MAAEESAFYYSSDTASGSNVTVAIQEGGSPHLAISGVYGRDDTLDAIRVYLTAGEAREIGQALLSVAEQARAREEGKEARQHPAAHPPEFEDETDEQTALREAAEGGMRRGG